MTTLRNRLGHLTIGMVLCVGACGIPRANSAELYTFEAPQFTVGETAPLLNEPPNSGDATFNTSFTSSAANSYEITNIAESAIITGLALFAPVATVPLQLTFNEPVTTLEVNFAVDFPLIAPRGISPAFFEAHNGVRHH